MAEDLTTETTPNTPISQDTTVSESVTLPPSEPQAPTTDSTPEVVNYTTPENTENKAKTEEIGQNIENTLENQAPVSSTPDILETTQKPEENPQTPVTQTAQTPPTEPLEPKSEPSGEQVEVKSIPIIIPPQNKIRELLTKARNAIQTRKRKKLEKIMTLFAKQTNVTNDEVEKLLHVSDATATRYLTILKKENKIKQSGKTGKGVSYSKI